MPLIASYRAQTGLAALLILLICILSLFPSTSGQSHVHPVEQSFVERTAQESDRKVAVSFGLNSYPYNSSAVTFGSALVERNEADDLFHALVCKGDTLIDMITRSRPTTHVWHEEDLDNGWYVDEDEKFEPSPNILPALRELEIPHDEDDVYYAEINQNVAFKIGNQEYPPTGGRYHNTYIPSGIKSTVIAQHNYSPKHQARPGQMIPPLYRASDVLWLYWTLVAKEEAGQIRYIIHENVVTAFTRKVMEYIWRAGPDALVLPWPGQLYDLRSEAGRALLATPHGIGIAYLIADHSDKLGGKKYPAVCIFTAPNSVEFLNERYNYYMIWELRDATESETELRNPRTCRDMI